MAESNGGGEKTESPTPKRKQKAFEDGQILRSRDFATAIVVLTGCAWMALLGPSLMAACKAVLVACFTFGPADVADFDPLRPLADSGWRLLPSLGGLFALTILVAVAGQAVLSGVKFNGKLLAPKPSRLNPASGVKRMFGPQGMIELGKSLMKVILLGAIGFTMLWSTAHRAMGLVSSDLEGAVGALGQDFIMLLFAMAAGLAMIAAVDLPIALFRHLNQLKMTKQEVKDEHKETEGSPEAKQALRGKQREVMKRSFRKAVAEAHVVLTNPTHFSVALRYDAGRDQVPVVVAKGRGETALALRELAREFEVPTLESPALARAVYFTSREGQEVRDDLYQAIAVALAFIFNVNARAGGSPPAIDVPETARFDEHGQRDGSTS
ncbi:EscU/YscU/HrcU family type III secretion system export apparatus switch protein [Stakelama saccharophila]|uniref:Flagellar type III secretion system protein FlhB n=1 Tax=Stakelama saccharophila TaxID=3075605 RepID=A0ABZ0B8G1_9SPHN|nr:flagellar type III secretion system protein FlhB [Stakelama sp. W311]WNO53706.1 flagellar type III secretion system protein FlhB [Stakelama sp. W311]